MCSSFFLFVVVWVGSPHGVLAAPDQSHNEATNNRNDSEIDQRATDFLFEVDKANLSWRSNAEVQRVVEKSGVANA